MKTRPETIALTVFKSNEPEFENERKAREYFLQAIQFRHQIAENYLDSKNDYPPVLVYLIKLVRAQSHGSKDAEKLIYQLLLERECKQLSLDVLFENNLLQQAKAKSVQVVLACYQAKIVSRLDWFSKREILAGLMHLAVKSSEEEKGEMLDILNKMRSLEKAFRPDLQFLGDIDRVADVLNVKLTISVEKNGKDHSEMLEEAGPGMPDAVELTLFSFFKGKHASNSSNNRFNSLIRNIP